MSNCLIFGGSKSLPGWFGALMQWKLKFNWAFPFVKKGFKACQDSLWQLFTPKTVIWQNCSNRPGKKCGGEGAKAIWAMPKCLQHEFEGGFPKFKLISNEIICAQWNILYNTFCKQWQMPQNSTPDIRQTRDAKSGKRGKRACAIFSTNCANFWPVYVQNWLN